MFTERKLFIIVEHLLNGVDVAVELLELLDDLAGDEKVLMRFRYLIVET
jgi:hypothetical protein